MLNPFLSVAKGFGDFHIQGYTGPNWRSQLHVDYRGLGSADAGGESVATLASAGAIA